MVFVALTRDPDLHPEIPREQLLALNEEREALVVALRKTLACPLFSLLK